MVVCDSLVAFVSCSNCCLWWRFDYEFYYKTSILVEICLYIDGFQLFLHTIIPDRRFS
jgi:hypothetical protein